MCCSSAASSRAARSSSSGCARSPTPGSLIAFAYGAWTLKPWAWPLGVAVAIFGIVVAILQVVLGGSSFFSQIISIVIDGAILYYLNQPTIKVAVRPRLAPTRPF